MNMNKGFIEWLPDSRDILKILPWESADAFLRQFLEARQEKEQLRSVGTVLQED